MTVKKRILFVDDEPLVLQGLQRLLRNMRAQWDMVFADNGPSALDLLAAETYDVVVADIGVRGRGGSEFLREVMARHPRTIRLVLSGQADAASILRVEGAAHQFLAKPCDPELLRSVILAATDVGGSLRSEEIRRVLGGIGHLPVLPATYQEIQDLLAQEDTTVEELGRVVQQDPGMTANLLKLVNSAYFGLRHRVSDPAEAVSFLGVETLKSLALLSGVFQQARDLPPCFNTAHLWQHSLDMAAACRQIGKLEGMDKAGQSDCFTSGLIHDVGLLILASGFPGEYRRIWEIMGQEPVSVLSAEMRVLGVHHGEVGAYLLGLWGLPAAVVEAVSHHHTLLPRAGQAVSAAQVVHAAEALFAARGDCGVFGQHREPDLQFLPAALGSRLETWRTALGQDAGGGR